jgi:hypothetical protein
VDLDLDLAIAIRHPPFVVFEHLADLQDSGDHSPSSAVPELEKIPPGPTVVGTRWREVVPMVPGVRMTVWSQATDVDPDLQLEETFVSSWTDGTLEYTVSATGDGTLLRQPETLTPKGPLRLLDFPIAAMLRPALVKRPEETRDLLEAADGPGTNVRRTDGEAGLQAIGVAERPKLAPCD